jgi:hypothetical protein
MRRILALGSVLLSTSLFAGGSEPAAPPAASAPAFDHIFVIVEENMDERQVVGNPQAPFINDVLFKNNWRQTNYFGLNHGSLPDYLGLVSGSEHKQVIGDPPSDCTPSWGKSSPSCAIIDRWPSNIADSIEGSGRSWRAYLQSMGWACRWQSNTDAYDVTHNPFVYFETVQGGGPVDSQRCRQHDVDLSGDGTHSLAADLRSEATTPNFVFIAPDNAHNMHDGNVAQADRFLQDLFTGSDTSGANGAEAVNIFGSPAWRTGRSIAYVVWDEDAGSVWNQVAMVAVGPWVNGPSGRDAAYVTHYSMLRTWEAAWNLPPIGAGDRTAAPMLSAFNLLPDGATNSPPARLPQAHPEVYARVEVTVRSDGAAMTLLSLGGVSGEEFRLFADDAGRLAFQNRSGDPPLITRSDQVVGAGWHTVELHVWVRGAAGTCEVRYDGRPVPALGGVAYCPTGSAWIQTYSVGDASRVGGIQTKNLALATSPL